MSEVRSQKGSSLELDAAAYFQAHGYLVRRGVKLAVAEGSADATDIDVLGVRFGTPLAEERLVADCKDRKKPQTFERILWTKGLGTFFDVDRCIVITPRARWQAREFAARGGVEVLGAQEIDVQLKSARRSFEPFGEANPDIGQLVELSKRRVKQPQDKELLKADLEIRQMLIDGHPLTNLNGLIITLSELNDPTAGITQDGLWLRHYVSCSLAVISSVMLVRFAAESKWTPESDWKDYARKKLTFGDVPPQKVRELTKIVVDQDFFESVPSPGYTEEIVGLIEALIHKPAVTAAVPYALDFLLLGQEVGGASEDSIDGHLGGSRDEVFKTAKRILSVLSYAANVPTDIWYSGVKSPGSVGSRAPG